MDNTGRIPGEKEIRRRLPEGWRNCWLYFNTILDFQLRRVSDFGEPPRYDGSMLICDESETIRVRLTMKNVAGNLPLHHQISGLDIEDASYSRGYETTVRYRIVDFEDPEFAVYCEELFAEPAET